ncbi:hypothetical protein LOAG_13592 [Loa loa]|uniref:Uncharacterized protein n=1 Tax=Loa loa TaxID=7209 RepID=A0A1S0TJA5_LOALO|nr:hypothetical protein LOAG_13592 [Loa loa]EFO14922.1 hypothetical protein LOAG_13592 [Loa loa]
MAKGQGPIIENNKKIIKALCHIEDKETRQNQNPWNNLVTLYALIKAAIFVISELTSRPQNCTRIICDKRKKILSTKIISKDVFRRDQLDKRYRTSLGFFFILLSSLIVILKS